MEDPIMKKILEESPEIAEADRRLSGSFLAATAAVRPLNQEFIADAQLRSRLDARDKFVRTNAQLMHDAEQKGLEQGREEGLEKGREQGLEEGRRETARKMKRDGLDGADIARYTGLPEEEIREL